DTEIEIRVGAGLTPDRPQLVDQRGNSPRFCPASAQRTPERDAPSGLTGRAVDEVCRYAGGWNPTLPTEFQKLNDGWDAEPNAPEPHVRVDDADLTLTFFLSPWSHTKIREYDRGEIIFRNCWRYRVGAPNDEGWYKGHCRFRCLAPEWGDFYEVTGG